MVDYEESSGEQNETSDDYVTEEECASTSGYEKRIGQIGKKKAPKKLVQSAKNDHCASTSCSTSKRSSKGSKTQKSATKALRQQEFRTG